MHMMLRGKKVLLWCFVCASSACARIMAYLIGDFENVYFRVFEQG